MDGSKHQLNLFSMLLLSAAAPIWIFLCVALPDSPGFGGSPTRYFIPPFALTGITFVIHRLLRGKPNSIALSVFLAPIIALSALITASFLAG